MTRLVALVCSLAVYTSAAGLWAQAPDGTGEAARLGEAAAAAYNIGHLDEAIRLFAEAMAYVPDPAFAFNIAYIYEELGELYLAHRHYGQYLELYPGAPNRDDVEAQRAALEARFTAELAELRIDSVPEGADVWVESRGRRVRHGRAPLTTWVVPGPVAVEAELEGYQAASRGLNAVAGVRLPLELVLLRELEGTPSVRRSPLVPWGSAALAVGVGLLGTGVAFWILAEGAASDYNEEVARIGFEGETPSLRDLRDARETAEDRARLGNVFFGVGTVLAVAGGALLVYSVLQPGETGGEVARHNAVSWWVAPAGLGLELSGRF
jgi:tetratricopeptide (TPR) repeat protein